MSVSQPELCDKMKQKLLTLILSIMCICRVGFAQFESQTHHINFSDVPAIEFIRFVSKISQANFIFDHRELGFNITMSSGKPLSSDEVVEALVQMLRMHGFAVSAEGNYFVIHRYSEEELKNGAHIKRADLKMGNLVAGDIPSMPYEDLEFATYKLRFHQGEEIEMALKKIASDMSSRADRPVKLIDAIKTIQSVKTTNSLFFSGDEKTVQTLDKLIRTLDIPRRQVFIEVLVLETDSKKMTEFGLDWVGGGKFKDKVSFGAGNFSGRGGNGIVDSAKGLNKGGGHTGLELIPFGRGFDLGIIGDIILHKGKTFLTLGSLVSALEQDGDSTIVLNQKIITQDNKNSKIFVGDNIPFTGSVVSTVGLNQQTTANIEYRDVGVALSITPMLGEDGIISLDINQEITEAVGDHLASTVEVEGIRTTKTNMSTLAHVPDNHFLILSGMARNAKSFQRAGIPCLGGLPVIGAAFSKNKKLNEKRNVLIFVRPHIINAYEDYARITEQQEDFCKVPEEMRDNT